MLCRSLYWRSMAHTPHWASIAAPRRGTSPPQVLGSAGGIGLLPTRCLSRCLHSNSEASDRFLKPHLNGTGGTQMRENSRPSTPEKAPARQVRRCRGSRTPVGPVAIRRRCFLAEPSDRMDAANDGTLGPGWRSDVRSQHERRPSMSLDLADYERRARNATRTFWNSRDKARREQAHTGLPDQGERASVTAGKNMDGFVDLCVKLVNANGLRSASIHRGRAPTLPGYFRPTKLWDLLVLEEGRLIAAIELKSQVGPSFGNNFNNRVEEAIGSACDLWAVHREGAFADRARPFVGWLILVEDAPASRRSVKVRSPHFPAFSAFGGASYLKRYDLLCRRLVTERLYTAASVVSSPRSAGHSGEYGSPSETTGLKAFATSLAGHIAAEAARREA